MSLLASVHLHYSNLLFLEPYCEEAFLLHSVLISSLVRYFLANIYQATNSFSQFKNVIRTKNL